MKCNCCNKNDSESRCYICSKPMCNACKIIKTLNYDNRGVGNDWGTCKDCYEPWVYWMREIGKTDFDIFEMQHTEYDRNTIEQLYRGSLMQCDKCKYIWDGNAQCPCWQDLDIFDIFDSDDDTYQSEPKQQHDVVVCETMTERN